MSVSRRFAILVEYLHVRGGTQRQALELAQAFQQRGHTVAVFTRVLSRSACYPELQAGLVFHAWQELGLDRPSEAAPVKGAGRWMRRVLAVSGLRYLRDYALMAKVSRSWSKLLFPQLDAFAPDVLNPHDYGPAPWVSAKYARTNNAAVVWQCNDPYLRWTHGVPLTAKLLWTLAIRLDRRRCRGINTIAVLDSQVGAVVQRRYGVKPRIAHSGASLAFTELPERAASRRHFGLPAEVPVFLVLTLLNSRHRRLEDAIEAFAASGCDGRLFIVAPVSPENEYVQKIRAVVAGCGAAERIVWHTRALSGDGELKAIFAASDVLVFPNDQQSWGLAVVEGAMAGLTPVVSLGAGASEILVDGKNARLFPAMDRARLADIMRDLAAHPEERHRLGCAARELMVRDYNWTRFAERIDALAQEVC